jgi:RNA polymerase sigma factor (sigma-70 family)
MTRVGNYGDESHPEEREMQDSRQELRRSAPPLGQPPGGEAVAAFEEAYLLYAPRLQRIAIRRFRIEPGDAEVLVQDVFTTYFQHAANVQLLEPYLIGAICNASRNHIRRASASKALFCSEDPCAATPDEALLDELERKRLLSQMLARVGGPCRDLLRRFYMNGDGTEVLARVFNITRPSVKVKLFKCRQRALEAYRSIMEKSNG